MEWLNGFLLTQTQKTTANASGFSDQILRFNVFGVRLPARRGSAGVGGLETRGKGRRDLRDKCSEGDAEGPKGRPRGGGRTVKGLRRFPLEEKAKGEL